MHSDSVEAAFREQARACERLGSPFTAALLALIADHLRDQSFAGTRLHARLCSWGERAVGDALALRLAGGLHALVRGEDAPALALVYPPQTFAAEAVWPVLRDALHEHDDFLTAYLDRPPQTNEVARCSVLLGAALIVAERTGLPLAWYEIGASAGLNLQFDRYRYELGAQHWGDANSAVAVRSSWSGTLPPLSAPLRVVSRAACDVNPLDVHVEQHRRRLFSYVWADQAERIERLAAAMNFAERAGTRVAQQPASEFLPQYFAPTDGAGRVRMLVHTIVWQYLDEQERSAIHEIVERAGRAARPSAPVAWFHMEPDEQRGSAALTLTLWPGGERRQIGRGDFHGRSAEWFDR